jgi:integrase
MQQKTQQRPVHFEITETTRDAVGTWTSRARLRTEDFLFPSRVHTSPHLSTRQYAPILDSWVQEMGLDPAAYGTHSMRRTKASLIYRRTKTFEQFNYCLVTPSRKAQCVNLSIEVDDALEMAEQTEV